MNYLAFVGQIAAADGQPHSHGDFEVICFLSDGEIDLDGVTKEVDEGGAALIPPLCKHCVRAENAVRAVLDKALLPLSAPAVLVPEQAEHLVAAVNSAMKHKAVYKNHETIVSAADGQLIAALITAYAAPTGFSPTVNAVLDDIDKSFVDPAYSLESFLRSLPLNYDYVRKLFKKEVGITPHEYLMRSRMDRAQRILLSRVTNRYSEYTITQVAEACGFSEPLYFSRVFKKYFGVAPSHYLK